MSKEIRTPTTRESGITVRQEKIAEGVALIVGGMQIKKAAQVVGIPYSTLYAQYQRLMERITPQKIDELEDRILAHAARFATRSGTELAERLEDAPDDFSVRDLIASHREGRETVGAIQERKQGGKGDFLGNLAASILKGEAGEVTVKIRHEPTEAIDAEVVKEEEEL